MPLTLSTSTTSVATAYADQQGAVFVASDGTAIAIYNDGGNLVFRTASSPYTSWSAATTIRALTASNHFGAQLDGSDNVHVVFGETVSSIVARYVKLTKNGATWTVGTPVTVDTTSTINWQDAHEKVGVYVESGGRIWAMQEDNGPSAPRRLRLNYSDNGGTTWSLGVEFTGALNLNEAANNLFGLYPTADRLVVVFLDNTGLYYSYHKYTDPATTWKALTQVAPIPAGSAIVYDQASGMSAAQDANGNLQLAIGTVDTTHVLIRILTYTAGTDAWATTTTDIGTGAQDAWPAMIYLGSKTYCVWSEYAAASNYAIVYKVWNGSSWGAKQTVQASGANNVYPALGGNSVNLFVLWTQGTASPYNVQLAQISTGTHSTHTSASPVTIQVQPHIKHTSASPVAIQVGAAHNNQHTTRSPVAVQIKSNVKHTATGVQVLVSRFPPMPLISRAAPYYSGAGVPDYASSGVASYAIDASYGNFWSSAAVPTPAAPQWVALDLSGVGSPSRTRVVVAWYNESTQYFQTSQGTFYACPHNYTIEANAAPGGGGAAPTSGWVVLATVLGNQYNEREHVVDMTGYNWLRLVVTESLGGGTGGNNGVNLNLDVYDAHLYNNDNILLLGDSITAGGAAHWDVGSGTDQIDGNMSAQVSKAIKGGIAFPLIMNGGIPGETLPGALANIDPWYLQGFSGRYVALGYGTNDLNVGGQLTQSQLASSYQTLLALIDRVQERGMIPIVPYVPWGSINSGFLGINAQAFNAYVDANLKYDRPQALRGPDMYSLFYGRTDLLPDGIHPNSTPTNQPLWGGYDYWRHAWSAWMLARLYQQPRQTHTSRPVNIQVSAAGGKTHVYHTSLAGVAVQIHNPAVAHPVHNVQLLVARPHSARTSATWAVAVKQPGVKHTSLSPVALQVHNANVRHTASGVVVAVKQPGVKHTSLSPVALQVHNLAVRHTSLSPAAIQVHNLAVRHTAAGVAIQIHNASVRHTAASVALQVARGMPVQRTLNLVLGLGGGYLGPWVQGMTGVLLSLALQQPGAPLGAQPTPVNLTGATVAVRVRDNARAPADPLYERAGAGVVNVADALNGKVTYTLAAADVAATGDYALVVVADYGGGIVAEWPPSRWVIVPA